MRRLWELAVKYYSNRTKELSKELRVLKKQYNDYQMGIIEATEQENELKTKFNQLTISISYYTIIPF